MTQEEEEDNRVEEAASEARSDVASSASGASSDVASVASSDVTSRVDETTLTAHKQDGEICQWKRKGEMRDKEPTGSVKKVKRSQKMCF